MNQKIQDKLRLLLKHRDSAEAIGSLHEAELFSDKIQELLDKYNLSLSDIEMSERDKTMGESMKDICFKREWKQMLMRGVADVNGVVLVRDMPRLILVGTEEDREICYQLYSYFSELGEHLATLKSKEEKERIGYSPSKFRNSFMLGYAQAIRNRLYLRHKESLKNAQQSMALVYVGKKEEKSQEYVDSLMNTVKVKRRIAGPSNYRAYDKGVEAGNSVNLGDKELT